MAGYLTLCAAAIDMWRRNVSSALLSLYSRRRHVLSRRRYTMPSYKIDIIFDFLVSPFSVGFVAFRWQKEKERAQECVCVCLYRHQSGAPFSMQRFRLISYFSPSFFLCFIFIWNCFWPCCASCARDSTYNNVYDLLSIENQFLPSSMTLIKLSFRLDVVSHLKHSIQRVRSFVSLNFRQLIVLHPLANYAVGFMCVIWMRPTYRSAIWDSCSDIN